MSSYRNKKNFIYYKNKLNENIPYSTKLEPSKKNKTSMDFFKRRMQSQSNIQDGLEFGFNSSSLKERVSLPDNLFKMDRKKLVQKESVQPLTK